MKGKCRLQGNQEVVTTHITMTIRFVLCIFIIMALTAVSSLGLLRLLQALGVLNRIAEGRPGYWLPLTLFVTMSIVLGVFFSLGFSGRVLAPIHEVIQVADELANGNFDIHIEPKGSREMQMLSRSFNHMAEELSSLEMLRSDFVNDFSHEVKTPISSIRGFAKMLRSEELTPEERSEYLEIIISEADRLTELATNILNLSKLENQTILPECAAFNCSEQIRRSIALLEPKWEKKHQMFQLACDEIEINGNEELLEQVWINLFDNAIKFSPEGSVIEVLMRKRPEHVIITVKDCGPGIPPKDQAHIFEKFYRGDDAHATAGNGLGLAIASRIIGLHGGSIRIAETGEDGTTVEVVLPV